MIPHSIISAAPPVTNGVANDVPLKLAYVPLVVGAVGVFWDELIIKLGEELRKRGKNVRFFHSSVAMKDPQTIEKMIAPYLGGDNPLFGTITDRLHRVHPYAEGARRTDRLGYQLG